MPPINGNEIVRQIQEKRNSIPDGYGEITQPETGSVLASAFSRNNEAPPVVDIAAENLAQKRQQEAQMQNAAYEDIDRERIYAQEMADAGDNSAMMLANGATQDYVNGEAPMESFTPEELKEAQTNYLNHAGRYSNFAEENDIDMNEMYSRFSEEYTKDDIDMFKDARKIKNFDDAMKIGMMNDEMADFMNLDTEKYFGEGNEMELCGEECQQKRISRMNEEQILSMDDDKFMRL